MDANREFWSFSDKLRLETASLGSLSLGETIWSDSLLSMAGRRLEDLRNLESSAAAITGTSDPWKTSFGGSQKLAFANNHVDRYNNKNTTTTTTTTNNNNSINKSGSYFNGGYNNGEVKNYFNKAVGGLVNHGWSGSGSKNTKNNDGGKKKNNSNNNNNNNNTNGTGDKRFKTLPPSESLPRGEAVGGYIFVCNNDTMMENLRRQLFGLPPRYRDSVRAITPGLPLFLYNYSTHQLHGIFEAASFGGTNIDPIAWEDKKCPGESRFPAQVRVATRKIYGPLEEDSFRPVLHHYDGPKFRLELSVPEALELLDIFEANSA